MTLTFLNRFIFACALVTLSVLIMPAVTKAQSAVTLSVSPTLFEMTAGPTQVWSSNIRVINANEFPIQVYADAVNFAPSGESGQGTLIPVFERAAEGATLAEWIDVTLEELTVPAEQTISIPFTISVPEDAAPGGHFAAMLVGTKSFRDSDGAAQVETSQIVTSLVFLSVAGDVIESGQIRDFTTDSLISESPDLEFSLRFENTGNVHLQPQGDITITNMWGKDRGVVPINQNSQFGNVLPESIRKYNFAWTGDWSFADIGRYTAVATIAYGDKTRQFVSSKTSFWVIPWRALLSVLVIVGGLGWFIVWGLKLYIRRMLQLAGVTPELQRDSRNKNVRTSVSITAPLEEGILDLRSELRNGSGSLLHRITVFAGAYKLFLVIVAAVLVFLVLFAWYLVLALSGDRGYEVSYEKNGEMISLETEEIVVDELNTQPIIVNTLPEISLVNRSGRSEAASRIAKMLQARGYDVVVDASVQPVVEERTVIVYDPSFADDILVLQTQLENALVSSFVVTDPNEAKVTIYLGTDQAN
jgi:hypothetical protein